MKRSVVLMCLIALCALVEPMRFARAAEPTANGTSEDARRIFDTVRSRRLAVQLGFERIALKDDTLKCYFPSRPDSPYYESDTFHRILEFIQKRTANARLKQSPKLVMLIVDNMKSMHQLQGFLKEMWGFAVKG